jgi:hypothetical protein
MAAILTSGFTAISTMTTAYFGIKTMSDTAQSFARQLPQARHDAHPQEPNGPAGAAADPQPGDTTGREHGAGSAN